MATACDVSGALYPGEFNGQTGRSDPPGGITGETGKSDPPGEINGQTADPPGSINGFHFV